MLSLLLCVMAMLLGFVTANPACGNNAWIQLTNDAIDTGKNPSASGKIEITGGKYGNTIDWTTLHSAVQDCLFGNQNCRWNDYQYTCDTRPAWKTSNWHATLNIEFNCSDGPYTCYDARWY